MSRNAEILSRLETLLAVADHSSIREAALSMRVAPSALSAQLRTLEELLGETLLVRRPTGIELTSAGERWVDFARRAYASLDRVQCEEHAATPGELRLGAYPSLANTLLPRVLKTFLDENPQLQLTLTTAPSASLQKALLRRDLDGALMVDPPSQRGLVARLIFTSEFSFWRAKDTPYPPYPLVAVPVTVRLGRESTLKRHVEHTHGAKLRLLEVDTFEAAMAISQATGCWAVLPRHLLLTTRNAAFCEEAPPGVSNTPFGPHRIYLVLRQELRKSDILRRLHELLRAHARETLGKEEGTHAVPPDPSLHESITWRPSPRQASFSAPR